MEKFDLINSQDEDAAEVWFDKSHYYLTFREIAELRGLSIETVKERYKRAKYILSHSDQSWLKGLSTRAKHALLRNGYRSTVSVSHDVDILHMKESIGQKVASEIRLWLK